MMKTRTPEKISVSVAVSMSCLDGQLAIPEAQRRGVDDGQCAKLGRCGHAKDQSSHEHDGRKERGQSGEKALFDLFERSPRLDGRLDAARDREKIDHPHEREAHEDTRQNACEEQVADRDLRQEAVDHHDDARRNDGTNNGRGRAYGGRECRIEAALPHCLDLDEPEARCIRLRHTGHGGEDHAGHHVAVSESAADVPDEGMGKAENAIRDTGGVEQLACENEQRDRQQREAVDTRRHALHHDGERHHWIHQEVQQRAPGQRESDRHFKHQEDAEATRT